MTSVAVRQHTRDVRGCSPAHTGRPWLSASTHRMSVAVRVCVWVSANTHRTSGAVRQHTQDVCVCPSAHKGHPCVSVSTDKTSVCVRVCPSAHRGRLWLSISTHISMLVLGLNRLTLPVDCLGDFGPRGLSVQYKQDVCGCPSVHISTCWSLESAGLPFPWTVWVILAHVGCLFSTHRTSVGVRQQTQDVHGCLWLSVSTHMTYVAVRQHTHDVCGCPCVSVSRHRTSVAVHQYTYQHAGPSRGLFGGRQWLSISTHISTLVLGLSMLTLPLDCSGDFGLHGLSVQYTQDVCGCPQANTGRPWLPVCVCVFPSAHTGRLWLPISTHISTLVFGLSTLALPVDCLGDFGPHGLSVQYTQDVYGCPPAHTGYPLLSMAVHQHTQDIRGCPCVSVCIRQHTHDVRVCPSAHTGHPWLSVCVCVCPSAHTGRPWLSISTHISTLVLGLSTLALPVDCLDDFGLRGLSIQYTQDIRGCPPEDIGHPWLSVPVRGCPSAHTGRPTLISMLVLGLSMLALPVDCLGDFSPRGLSVQYTQDVPGCPPAHTGRLWLSVSTHRTSVCVHGCPTAHTGRLWLSVSTPRMFVCVRQHTRSPCVSVCVRQHTQDICGCPSVHISARCTHRTYVGVRQQTQDVRRLWLFVCVRLCPSAHTGCPWLSISTHISTLVLGLSKLVLGLSTLALPVECLGDFGPRGLSVQYTQDIRGCPSAHTGRSCVLVSTHRTSMAVFVCPCLSISTQDVRGCPSVHISARWTSLGVRQHTQYVRGCSWLSVSTHRTSVAVRVGLCVSVCVRQHTQDVRGCPSVHISARCSLDSARWPFPWTVQVILAHVGCLFSTHRTSVAVQQHTQDIHGCPCVSVCVRVSPSAHTGRLWLSISKHISTLVLALSTLALPVDCSGDFGPRGLSVQYTHDIRGCPSAHTGRPCVSVSTQVVRGCPCVSVSTHRTSVAVHQYTYQQVGPWTQHADPSRGLFGTHWTSVAVCVCPCVSVSTHRTSVAVHQYTYRHDVRGCLSAHIGHPWLPLCVRVFPSAQTGRSWLSISTHISMLFFGLSTLALPVDSSGGFGPQGMSVQYTHDVRGCPLAHTGRPWLSISTHISTLVVGLSTLAIPVDCSGDFGPCGLSVQYTQDVSGCPSAHTRHPWLSVCVSVCPCVSVSTHRTSVAVHQYTYQHAGPWTQHACPSRGLFGTHRTSGAVRVCPCVSVSTHRTSVAVHHTHRTFVGVRQHTQDVCGCLSALIGRPWLSVCVRVFPSEHTGHPCLSISTHISTLVIRISTLGNPVDCLGDVVPRGLSVQYTQDVRGCPPAHIGRPWVSVSTHRMSVCVRQHTQVVRGCPWVSVSTYRMSVAVHQYTYQHAVHTERPWVSASTHRTSVAVRVCPCFSVNTHRTFLAVHQYTYQHAVPWTQHTGPSRGLFGTKTTSVAVRVFPSAHTGHTWLSISTHISTLVLGISTLGHPVDCLGDIGPRGCPSAHTGHPWVSVSTHRTSVGVRQHTQDVCVCPSAPTGRLCVRQHTQVVRGCPCVSVSTHRTSVAVHQYTYQHVGPWTQHADPSRGLFGTHRTSVAVRVCHVCADVSTHRTSVAVHHTHRTSVAVHQHTQDIHGCPCVSVCVCVSPSAHTGRLWLSISTHISTLVLGLSTLALPVDCSGDFGPRGLSVQYTQDIRGCPSAHTGCSCVSVSTHRSPVAVRVCPSAHTGRLWLSISTHISTLVLGLSTLTLPVDCSGDFGPCGLSVQYTQDVRGCPSAHTGRSCVSVSTHWTSGAVRVCPCVSVSTHRTSVVVHHTHRTSVGVRQHTQDVCGCLSAHIGRPWLSVCVRVFPSEHTGHPWLSISTHISTLVIGISTLGNPVDCLGDVVPRGLSVQYTQDVRGCPPAHIGRPWVSVSTHRMSVCVRQHTQVVRGCPWVSVSTHRMPSLSISTHISTLVLRLSTLALPVDCSGNFGPRGLSVQYTQNVCGCQPAHTGRPWLFVCVRVFPSTHTGRSWLSISTHISTLVLGISTLGHPVDCLGDFGPRGLSVQYTQDVRGCLPEHTGRPWVSVSTHRTSVGVRQHTQDVRVCPSSHTGRLWLSVCVRQHTQDVCGCPSVHISALRTGRLWLPVSTHGTFVCVCLHTKDVCGSPCVSVCADVSTHRTSVAVHQYTYQHVVHGVRQHTQDVRGCLSAHIGRPWLSVCVRVFPSAHTGRSWLSISTDISTLFFGLSTLALPVDSSGDFGPRGMSVQYTHDVCGSHTGHPWLSISTHISTLVLGISKLGNPVDCLGDVAPRGQSVQYTQDVRGCPPAHTGRPWVSVSTHKTSVCVRQHTQVVRGCPWLSVLVRQHTQDVCGCPSVHISARWSLDSARWPFPWTVRVILAHVGCLFSTHRTSVAVHQHTQDIHVCPCVSVCVRVSPSAHTGRLWLSISTHISTLVLRLSTLALPVDCSGDFGPCGLSVQYTQDICGCPSAHTRHPWLSVCVSVCPCVSVGTHRTSVAFHQYTYQHAGPLWSSLYVAVIRRVAADGICMAVEGRLRCVNLRDFSEDVRILAKRQILGSRIRVFDTMPRDVRDQCAGFRARPRLTFGLRIVR
ncbi:hypothetical protein YC2023_066304 [Brassica napus]